MTKVIAMCLICSCLTGLSNAAVAGQSRSDKVFCGSLKETLRRTIAGHDYRSALAKKKAGKASAYDQRVIDSPNILRDAMLQANCR